MTIATSGGQSPTASIGARAQAPVAAAEFPLDKGGELTKDAAVPDLQHTICTTSPDVPEWVRARAAEVGIRFVPLDSLEPAAIAEHLARSKPTGYLMNWPNVGPRLTMAMADAAGALRIVTYMGQSPEAAFYEEQMDLAGLWRRGILTTVAPDSGEHPVAECAIGFLFALDLDLVAANTARKVGADYPTPTPRLGLAGSNLGIVGMGVIGRRVAAMARACGMRLVYFSRTRRPEVEGATGAVFADLPDLFADAHYVSLHLPAGAEGLIDQAILSRAQAIGLINTTSIARLVDPEALLHALENGWVRKAALEGRYREPHDSRLRAIGDDRVLLMPPYTSYSTRRSMMASWQSYLESLVAMVYRRDVPHQIRRSRS